jgi:hypothetical protein
MALLEAQRTSSGGRQSTRRASFHDERKRLMIRLLSPGCALNAQCVIGIRSSVLPVFGTSGSENWVHDQPNSPDQ